MKDNNLSRQIEFHSPDIKEETSSLTTVPGRESEVPAQVEHENDNGDESEDDENDVMHSVDQSAADNEMASTTRPREPAFPKAMFLLCGIITFGMSFGLPTGLSIFFLDWQDSFQGSRADTAAIHATCIGSLNIGAIVPGLLMGRIGARATLLTGCLLAFLGMVLSFFATSISYMIVTTGIVFGLGCSMINLPIIPCITQVFTSRQSLVIAALCFGSGVLNTVLPYVYRVLIDEYSWRGALLIIGAVTLNACITILVITSFRTPKPHSAPDLDIQVYPTSSQSHTETFESEKDFHATNDQELFPTDSKTLATTPLNLSRKIRNSESESVNPLKELPSRGKKYEPNALKNEPNSTRCLNNNNNNMMKNHPFLLDPLYLILVVTAAYSLSSLYSFVALMMDFSKSKGYEERSTGVFFVFIVFLFSMPGKLCTGLLNLIPCLHSIYILCIYAVISCVLLIVVDYIEDYYFLCVVFAMMGYILGGFAAIYPKCVLDLRSVSTKAYPLALGITIAVEGVFDSILPTLAGYTVDQYESYTLVLHTYGLVSAGMSTVLCITFCVTQGLIPVPCDRNKNK